MFACENECVDPIQILAEKEAGLHDNNGKLASKYIFMDVGKTPKYNLLAKLLWKEI